MKMISRLDTQQAFDLKGLILPDLLSNLATRCVLGRPLEIPQRTRLPLGVMSRCIGSAKILSKVGQSLCLLNRTEGHDVIWLSTGLANPEIIQVLHESSEGLLKQSSLWILEICELKALPSLLVALLSAQVASLIIVDLPLCGICSTFDQHFFYVISHLPRLCLSAAVSIIFLAEEEDEHMQVNELLLRTVWSDLDLKKSHSF